MLLFVASHILAEIHSCPVAPDLLEVKHSLSERIHKKEDLIVELHKGASRDTEDNVMRVVYKDMIIQSREYSHIEYFLRIWWICFP